jgi:hypothetical protein
MSKAIRDMQRKIMGSGTRIEHLVAVDKAGDTLMLGAVRTAEDAAILLHAVTHDADAAMGTGGCERGDGALKAVEDKRLPSHGDLEGLVIVVTALCAFAHDVLLPSVKL